MVKKNSEALLVLRTKLQAWAQAFGHTQNSYIVGLNASLENPKDLEFWQGLDPLEYLPNFNAMRSSGILKTIRLIAGIRNILIFVPVALTWAAVAQATKAFNEFIMQNSGTPANFLQFWQDGYGLLDPFWRIGTIAELDFIIVAIIIVLTSIVSVMQARAQGISQGESIAFTNARTTLALEINATLYDYRIVQTGSVSAEVAKSVRSLRAALANGESIEKPYGRLSKNVSDAATQVKSATGSLKTQLGSLQREIAKAEKKLGK
jgi:hypothetical protein